MDHILLQKLRDAGFPVKYHDVQYDIASGGKSSPIREVLSPTLSELIEGCKIKQLHLEQKEDGNWLAYGRLDWRTDGEGKTPEEAVAKLYLALHGISHTD